MSVVHYEYVAYLVIHVCFVFIHLLICVILKATYPIDNGVVFLFSRLLFIQKLSS